MDSKSLRETVSSCSMPSNQVMNWASLLGAGLLVLWGLKRWPLSGMLATATGAGLMYWRLGRNRPSLVTPPKELEAADETTQEDRLLDEASQESFPASDAPARY